MSSLFDILVMSEFFKMSKWAKFVRNWVSPKNHPKFDILVMSDFFKTAKCTKFVRNWVSSQNHLKFDILVMSDFSKIAKCTKFVRNWVSYKNHPKFEKIMGEGGRELGTLIFWWILQHYTKNTNVYYRKHNFVRILCIWLFWKTLTWLVYQISGDFWGKLNLIRILSICLFWKTLTWLVCQKGLTFFKSPRNVSPRSAPIGASLGSTFRGLWWMGP